MTSDRRQYAQASKEDAESQCGRASGESHSSLKHRNQDTPPAAARPRAHHAALHLVHRYN